MATTSDPHYRLVTNNPRGVNVRSIRSLCLPGTLAVVVLALSCPSSHAGNYPSVNVGGFVGVQYYDDASTDAGSVTQGWKFKCARLHARPSLSENLGGIIQYEACTGTPVITVAYVSLKQSPHTSINVGHVKLSFGIDIYRHPLTNPTINASYASTQIWPGSDMGVQLTHARRFGFVTVSFQNGNPFGFTDNNDAKSLCGKLVVHLMEGLGVGGSYYNGKLGTEERATDRFAGQMEYKSGSLWVRGELLGSREEPTAGAEKVNRMGYYGVAAYRLLPRVEAVARYDTYDPDTSVEENERSNVTLGCNYYLADKGWDRFSINYEIRDDKADEHVGNLLTGQVQILF
jgi:hypothetical protein